MGLLTSLLIAYVLGGLTLLPALALLAYHTLTIPYPGEASRTAPNADNEELAKEDGEGLPPEVQLRARDSEAASGYFAVTREYVPGGISGKPLDKPTASNGASAGESPSVYQSMYRSIFERNRQTAPSMDANRGNVKANRRPRNVFFVVLRFVQPTGGDARVLSSTRLAHLMLYDDEDQLEVRYVIALEQYDIDLYGAEDKMVEGELFVKRNCIRLRRRESVDELSSDPKPFFFYSDNCSRKENFYHAMLHAQQPRPAPLQFDQDHVVKLVRLLHSSEDTVQTRWLNSLIGRLFLSLYRTRELSTFISTRIAKKISRVQKPTFIERITLRRIDLGDSAPLVTNPKLKELNLDGDLTLEADVKYYGNFRLEISAIAKIDLGQRFKPRQVTLMLAGILKSLQGHVLFRIKPPPSNRIWFSFETMPKLDLVVEPVVSTRQITYSVILRAIENRIREVIGETLVQPNWDDVPFFDTRAYSPRGGLWEDTDLTSMRQAEAEQLTEESEVASEDESTASPYAASTGREKTMSLPILPHNSDIEARDRELSRDSNATRVPKSLSKRSSQTIPERSTSRPDALRSGSFASAATPIASKVSARAESRFAASSHNSVAGEALRDVHESDLPSAHLEDQDSPSPPSLPLDLETPSHGNDQEDIFAAPDPSGIESSPAILQDRGQSNAPSSRTSLQPSTSAKRQSLATTAASATATAAKWGYDMLQRRKAAGPAGRNPRRASASQADSTHESQINVSTPSLASTSASGEPSPTSADFSQPIGRGQPLPPPGQPLPGPRQARRGWGVAPFGVMTRRKPVPVRSSTGHAKDGAAVSSALQAWSDGPSEETHRRRNEGRGSEASTHGGDVLSAAEAHVPGLSDASGSSRGRFNDFEDGSLPPRDTARERGESSPAHPSEADDHPMSSNGLVHLDVGREAIETKDQGPDMENGGGEADFGDWEENVPITPSAEDEQEAGEHGTEAHTSEEENEDDAVANE